MASMIYILFLCITLPLVMLMFLLDVRSRLIVGFMLVGMYCCLLASEVNGVISNTGKFEMTYLTTNLTPLVEEIIKAIPVLFFALFVSDDREKILGVAMAVGIGFAILENAHIMTENIEMVSIAWAVIRGVGAGLMHGVCTMSVGLGASFVKQKRILFLPGTIALLFTAVIYHGCYNLLIQSVYRYIGIVMPIVTYIPLLILILRHIKKTKENQKQIMV